MLSFAFGPVSDMFRDLYLWKGTFFAITDDNSTFPTVASLLSMRPNDVTGKREPAGEDKYRTLSSADAREMFGDRIAVRLGGTTVRAKS